MFNLSKRSKLHREGIDPSLIEISDLAITLTVVDFGHPEDAGLRTAERQKELFDSGDSGCDGVKNKSHHQSGNALDFYAYVDGKGNWEPLYMALVACAFLESASILGYKLEWSGLWRGGFKEGCHVQLLED